MLDLTKINKTIGEIRKENWDEGKILRDLDFTFDPEKDHYEPKEAVCAFNNNYIQYESVGDKDKNLSTEEYIDVIRPYLSDITNNHETQSEWKIHSENIITEHKTQGEWKIYLTIAINFISFEDSDETRAMHTKSYNTEIMMVVKQIKLLNNFLNLFCKDVKKD